MVYFEKKANLLFCIDVLLNIKQYLYHHKIKLYLMLSFFFYVCRLPNKYIIKSLYCAIFYCFN